MLSWLSKLFGRPYEVQSRRRSSSPVRVVQDDKLITLDDGVGEVASMLWSSLGTVTVMTTNLGPFEIDLFWVLTDKDGWQTLMIPMDAQGEKELLEAMQARLPGFDNMAVIEAMSSTDNGVFQVWPAVEVA
jgi:hypothetical protein